MPQQQKEKFRARGFKPWEPDYRDEHPREYHEWPVGTHWHDEWKPDPDDPLMEKCAPFAMEF